MANLFENPSSRANLGYSGFDMGNVLKFTSTTGELLPVYYDILQPGDKVTCRTELRTRTMPLQTAAFTHVQERVEWFFVPMRYLYSLFNDWYYGISDIHSSRFDGSQLKDKLPYITGSALTTYLHGLLSTPVNDSMHSSSPVANTKARNTQLRLMELLGLPISRWYNDFSAIQESICPILACAYQKIWFDYYRLSDRIANEPSYYNMDRYYNDLTAFNLSNYDIFTLRYRPRRKDFFTHVYTSPLMGAQSTGAFSQSVSSDILDLTKSFNQWLASGMSLQTSESAYQTSNGGTRAPILDNINPTQVTNGDYSVSSAGITTSAGYNALSPTQIRTSFAVQKLLEVTRRAGKHWDAQTLAHFGVKVPKNLSGEVIYLGQTCDSPIEIGDVISTAETTTQALGTVAGKGYTYNAPQSDVQYEATEHGVLMALYSAEVYTDYAADGLDKLNTMIDSSNWPRPEFDNLGMQPLFFGQLHDTPVSGTTNYSVYGWQYRYSEFKTKFNRVCGGLIRHHMQPWTTLQYFRFYQIGGGVPVKNFYCSPFDLDSIMVKPYEFCGDTSYTESYLYDSDPLIHQIMFDVKKASKMSTYGLEQI